MQCDLSVMISNEMFNRFIMPELQELTDKRCKEIDALTAAKEKELMAV